VEAFGAAKRSALRARAIEPALAEARPALAYVAMYHDWDWDGAEREFQDAIRLNPGYATAYENLGDVYAMLAADAYGQAQRLEPRSTSLPRKLELVRQLAGPQAGRAAASAASGTAKTDLPAKKR
jgi:tetratricopeptide (TPR) repeat protein